MVRSEKNQNQKVLLAYSNVINAQAFGPIIQWSELCNLWKESIDISKYTQLIALLKRKSEGYKPKKSNTLTKEDVIKFL